MSISPFFPNPKTLEESLKKFGRGLVRGVRGGVVRGGGVWGGLKSILKKRGLRNFE